MGSMADARGRARIVEHGCGSKPIAVRTHKVGCQAYLFVVRPHARKGEGHTDGAIRVGIGQWGQKDRVDETAAVAPRPSASVRTAVNVNPGARLNWRIA